MSDRPTLYLSNWASAKTPGHHGPGRKLTIMRRPRSWEHGDGRVPGLIPGLADLTAAQNGTITTAEYRARYVARFDAPQWSERWGPDINVGTHEKGLYTTAGGGSWVTDGDTLCCACSREDAAAGGCHRAWAAAALVKAGWRVILDGAELEAL